MSFTSMVGAVCQDVNLTSYFHLPDTDLQACTYATFVLELECHSKDETFAFVCHRYIAELLAYLV